MVNIFTGIRHYCHVIKVNWHEGVRYLREEGVGETWKHVKACLRITAIPGETYSESILRLRPSAEELEKQKNEKFTYAPLISILVPLYKTNPDNMRRMIDSVVSQSYQNWELCLADGSGDGGGDRLSVLQEYEAKDKRIRFKELDKNYGISGNTNKADEMATGEWFALLDHDDILEPDALYEMVKRIQDPDVDMVYTDEDKTDGTEYNYPHFKCDYNEDLLRSCNYITHLICARRSLIPEGVDMFRSDYDGSQDYDLILRLTADSRKVEHVPKILYHWLMEPGSTAFDPKAKEYCYTAGCNAVQSCIDSHNIPGKAVRSKFYGIYDVEYPTDDSDKVSVIIAGRGRKNKPERAREAFENSNTYKNVEVMVHKGDSSSSFTSLANEAAGKAAGKYLLFLSPDTIRISSDLVTKLVAILQRPEKIAAVGPVITDKKDYVISAGQILGGKNRPAGEGFAGILSTIPEHNGYLASKRDVSSISEDCIMIAKDDFIRLGGFDTKLFKNYSGADLCLKLISEGKRCIIEPYARISEIAVSKPLPTEEADASVMNSQWGDIISKGDPYYNPNMSYKRADYSWKGPDDD